MLFLIDNNKTCIYFDKGKFDKYCVYINGRNKFRYAPTDDVYFNWIRILAKQYGNLQVWNDFCTIYDIVDTSEAENEVLNAENEASDKMYAAPEENKGGEEA